jgi:hypothetical protein
MLALRRAALGGAVVPLMASPHAAPSAAAPLPAPAAAATAAAPAARPAAAAARVRSRRRPAACPGPGPAASAAQLPPPFRLHQRGACAPPRALALKAVPPGAPDDSPKPSSSSSSSSSGAGSPCAAASGSSTAPSSSGSGSVACDCGCGVLGWNTNFDGPSGRFTLGREVGRGSFGVVRVAVHRDTGREYAAKILSKCRGAPSGGSNWSAGSPPPCSGAGSPSTPGAAGAGGGSPVMLTAGTWSASAVDGASAGGGSQHLEAIEREVTSWMSVQVCRLAGRRVCLGEGGGSARQGRGGGAYAPRSAVCGATLLAPARRLARGGC